ncbi:LYRM1-like protein [Mya arenaria]|uniref:LYRM1-like protein n=1 Tax=Mya arenaria TaxID=6604 RepID=A0ABY7DIF6_MYAAR|nr:LYRM1-like protein [Mya arenaria]
MGVVENVQERFQDISNVQFTSTISTSQNYVNSDVDAEVLGEGWDVTGLVADDDDGSSAIVSYPDFGFVSLFNDFLDLLVRSFAGQLSQQKFCRQSLGRKVGGVGTVMAVKHTIQLSDESLIREHLKEGETRIELAMHYQNPYPRPVHLPQHVLHSKAGKRLKAQQRKLQQSKPIYIKSYEDES